MDAAELAFAGISRQAELIREGEVSSRELVQLLLDHYLNWKPWGVIAGAALGMFGGLAHLIALANRHEESKSPKDRRDAP